MNFAKPHRFSQLGFTSCKNNEAPLSFFIVGSSDCGTATVPQWITWTKLLYVADSGFPNDMGKHVFKTYTVPPQERQAFPCIGLQIEKTGSARAALKNITLWEEAIG